MPIKPAKPCAYQGCPELTHNRYCDKHQKESDAQYNKFQRDPLSKERYRKQWRLIRNRFIKTNPLCQECMKNNKMTPAEEVHHILPLSRGGTHDEHNLMSLCKGCHSRITAKSGGRWRLIEFKNFI